MLFIFFMLKSVVVDFGSALYLSIFTFRINLYPIQISFTLMYFKVVLSFHIFWLYFVAFLLNKS